jgi:hypothetical protein
MNVRRLAAIDMFGTKGAPRRARIVLAEFVVGVVVMVPLGIWIDAAASNAGSRVFGAWLMGAGLNYAPLAAHAVTLRRPGALQTELAGVDTGRELRRYGVRQLWIAVPLSLLAFEIAAHRSTNAD